MKRVLFAVAAMGCAALAANANSAAAKPNSVQIAGDAAEGAKLYESRCTACHALDVNRIGPAHRGVVGRKAGTVPGFDYSPALKKAGVVWTSANLDRWLSGPTAMVPGVRMGFSLANPDDRRNVIAYLTIQTAEKP